MPTIAQTILQMEQYFKAKQTTQIQLAELRPENFFDSTAYDEQKRYLEETLRSNQKNLEKTLEQFDRFPPRHFTRHQEKLSEFYRSGAYAASVFIMTKFPEGDTELDRELGRVIGAVKTAIEGCNYTPRIASAIDYHEMLWDNVELYLLGCGRGVAIIESKYRPELNPNVAMEWGWMRGMGKNVLYLFEENFNKQRADWSGLSEERFPWASPEDPIKRAVEKWLRSP